MMCGLNKFLTVAFAIWIFYEAQVQCYFYEDLNPSKFDSNVWQQYQRNPRVAVQTNDQLACEKPNIYICEEPPNAISADSSKTCNFRNTWYHEQVFKWVAGRGCLLYTPDFLYEGGRNPINLNAGCFYGNLFAPCLEVAKDDGTCACYPFDPSFEEVSVAVRNALVPSAHGRWENCYYAASDCCSHFMGNTFDNEQCGPTFDGWTCWQPALNGSIASSVCPPFAYSNIGPQCHHYSSKPCYENGTWELQTDYSTCSITPRLLSRYRYHIAMLTFSIITCLPAVFIFFFYKRLRVTRINLHRNLLIAIIVRNILVIISRSEIYINELVGTDDTAMSLHGIACRVLALAERIAVNTVFVCMLVEGIYLHRLIVAVFKKKLRLAWLYGIGAVIAIIPVVAWASVMGLHNDHSCWVVYTVEHIQWTLDGPRIFILLLNTILFIDVLRVLLTKLRNSENASQLNTTKATLFLMPIFGTQFIFTALRPKTTNCSYEQSYYFIAYTVEGLQGFIVALLYCYINKEVLTLIKATYNKAENVVVSRIRGSNYPRMSVDPNTDRRFTYSTGFPSNTNTKNRSSTLTPKLHVAEIISIQASERLAEILEPVYETINNGVVNEGYDYLERSDCDSGYMPNRNSKVDDYYGFTNASSVSIGCPDWLKSAPGSDYDNSVIHDKSLKRDGNTLNEQNNYETTSTKPLNIKIDAKNAGSNKEPHVTEENIAFERDGDTMLYEIMQYMDNGGKEIILDPDVLSPNRPHGDKIIFVDD